MFVEDLRLAAHLRGGHHTQLGILRLDGVVELSEPAFITPRLPVEIVLVAYLDIFQLEGRRMSVLGPSRAPRGAGAARHVFDFVQRVLDEGLQIFPRRHPLPRQRVARIDRQHGVHVQVFAPFQELQQPHAVRRPVPPGVVHVSRPLRAVADGLLPVEARGDGAAFHVIAARKSQEGRLHVGQELHNVLPVAVGTIVPCRRKQRNHAEPHRAGAAG